MILLRPGEAMERLERSFPVPGEALSRCDAILRLQHESLAREPAPPALSEAVRIAASARLRDGEPVIPRERFPFETSRISPLLIDLVDTLADTDLPDEPERSRLVEAAVLAARADDGAELVRGVRALGLTAETGPALLREALKPEMLRTSLPFARWLAESDPGSVPPSGRCRLCGATASCGSTVAAARADAATVGESTVCRWCGLTWRWSADACPTCDERDLQRLDLARVRGAYLQRCEACGDVLPLFEVPADPLLLSLHSALAAPFVLATLAGTEQPPRESVVVF